jgi:glutamine amidotransferase-like uncharacterized protein
MKSTIALFVADPKCSVQCCNGMIQALGSEYNFKLFSRSEIEDGFFDNVDIVAFPGGIGDSDSFSNLFRYNQKKVKEFVSRGGKYLGICMGAYWAGKHYFDILDNIDAVQYIKRPTTDTKRPHAKNIKIKWNGVSTEMFFYDGCALVGNGEHDTIATYSNGDPMAIIQRNIGLIGCHPESEKFWYDMYSWMSPHWHYGTHHKLLLDFVKKLENNA